MSNITEKNRIDINNRNSFQKLPARFILIAGLAGGLIETIWVTCYSLFTSVSVTEVARQITATVVPGMAESAMSPALGLAIHFVLSITLAYFFVKLLLGPISTLSGKAGIFFGSLITLAVIWAANFLIFLPMLNPGFLDLMPYVVTLFSKLLFGLAMAMVLLYGVEKPLRIRH